MTRPYRFRTLFFRQWLNSIGIPLLFATLFLVLFPSVITLLLLGITSCSFLLFALFGKQRREDSVALLLASLGIALAFFGYSVKSSQLEWSSQKVDSVSDVVGVVYRCSEETCDIIVSSVDGKFGLKYLRLTGNKNFSVGSRVDGAIQIQAGLSEEERKEGITLKGRLLQGETVGKDPILSAVTSLRSFFFEKLGDSREGSFLKAVLLGEKSGLSKTDRTAFQKVASSHILAISGLHITLLLGMMSALMGFFRIPLRWARVALVPAVLFLFFLCGGAISVFRASVMTLFSLAACFLKRQGDAVTALVFAASLIVLQNPFAVTDASFLLSFVSTFAIVTVASPLCSAVSETLLPYFDNRGRKWLYSAAASLTSGVVISAATFLFTFPIQLFLFDEIQLFSSLYALIFLPLFTPCLMVGMVFLVGLFFPFGSAFLGECVRGMIGLFLDLVTSVASSSPPLVSFGNFSDLFALFFLVLLLLFMAFRRKLRDFLLLYVFLVSFLLPFAFLS